MEISLLKSLLDSITCFSQLSSCESTESEPVQKYHLKTEEILKLLKPILDAIIDAETVSDELLQNAFAGLLQTVNELREICENWLPLTSKIYFVLQAEPLISKIRTQSVGILELLKSSNRCLPDEISASSLEQLVHKIKNAGSEQTTLIITKAIKDHKDDSGASSDNLAKVADSLALKSNQELLIEAVALEKLKENAEQAEKTGEVECIDQIISTVTHMHDLLVTKKQSEICNPVVIPADFCCPLSLEVMTDPVVVASGQTYERAFIRNWIDLGLTVCPKTRQTLAHTNLIPNYTVKALIANWCKSNNVKLPDPTKSVKLNRPSSLTADAVEELAGIIKLSTYSSFSLFECAVVSKSRDPGSEEYCVLDDNKYIGDLLADFKASKDRSKGEILHRKLTFKRKLFLESDEAVTDPKFVQLSYVQLQHDYLLGYYPLGIPEVEELCALQILAEIGYVSPESSTNWRSLLKRFLPRQVATTRYFRDLEPHILSHYRSMGLLTKDDARQQFNLILSKFPFGKSVFFAVRKIKDPVDLPGNIILGINKFGVNFFNQDRKKYLHSAKLKQIARFSSSINDLFLTIKVDGVLQILKLDTKQGDKICAAIRAHLNDRKLCQDSEARAAAHGNVRPTINMSEKRISELSKSLEESEKKINQLQEELHAVKESEQKIVNEKISLEERLSRLEKKNADEERMALKFRVTELETNLEEAARNLVVMQSTIATKDKELSELKNNLKELEELREMKEDIDRKNEQTAAMFKTQGSKLAEMEALYKEESILRKRHFNMLEDMKGKIRDIVG